MRRPPSPRELIATLIACANNDDDEELQQLLVGHLQNLAKALHRTPEALRAVCAMAPAPRLARLGTLVKQAQVRDAANKARTTERVAMDAASQVAALAKWREDCVELDTTVVLGRELLAGHRTYIRFDADGFRPVTIRKSKLIEARRSLRFSDLTCRLNAQGLCWSWRAGKGRLTLTSQPVATGELDTVLSIVIARPVIPAIERKVAPVPKPGLVKWFIEALAHANPI